MGFLAPAMPWIIKGGAALGSYLLSKKSQKSAMKRSPEEATALTGAQEAAGNLTQTGGGLIRSGQQTLAKPADYWSRLLGSNRALAAQATAAPRAAIGDIYSGAERNLERSGVRGAAKDVASAELGRERAGKIAGLTTGVQPGAAGQLGEIGSELLGRGAPMLGQAGNIYSSLLGQGTYNRVYGRAEGERTGEKFGGLIFDMLSGMGGKGKKPNLSFDRPGSDLPPYISGGIDPYRMY